MCRLKSAIILKDRIFVADYDSHTQMLEELKIEDTRENASRLFVRAELYPIDDDIFSNVENWVFKVDQDIVPEWFVKDYDKERMQAAIKEWHNKHVFIGIDNLELQNGGFYLKDCKSARLSNSTSEHYGNSTSKHYGNSTSEHYGNSTSKHYGNSTSKHYDYSTSEHYGNSTSKHYGNSTSEHYDYSTSENYDYSTSKHYDYSTSEHYGNSTSKHYGYSTSKHYGNSTSKHYDCSTSVITRYSSCKKENIVLCDNSTLKDCITKTIYQSGEWKLELVGDNNVSV